MLSANSFLSMAEPVQCLSASSMFDGSSFSCDAMLSNESALPVSSSPLSNMIWTDGTELRASSVSTATVEATAPDSPSSSSEGQLDHIEGLLCSLPDGHTSKEMQTPDPALDLNKPALQFSGRLQEADAFTCGSVGMKAQELRQMCDKWPTGRPKKRRRATTAAIEPSTHCTGVANCADSETIRPLFHPTDNRYRRSAELIVADLDTADSPDTPYQSSAAMAAEVWLPPDTAIRLFPRFKCLRWCTTRCLSYARGCA